MVLAWGKCVKCSYRVHATACSIVCCANMQDPVLQVVMDTMIKHWADEVEGEAEGHDESHGDGEGNGDADDATGPDADDDDALPDAVDPYVLLDEIADGIFVERDEGDEQSDGQDGSVTVSVAEPRNSGPESPSAQVLPIPEASAAQPPYVESQDPLPEQGAPEDSSTRYVESQSSSSQIAPEASSVEPQASSSSQIAPEASPVLVESQESSSSDLQASSAKHADAQKSTVAQEAEVAAEALLASSAQVAAEAAPPQDLQPQKSSPAEISLKASYEVAPKPLSAQVAMEAAPAQLLQETSPAQAALEAAPAQLLQDSSPAQVAVEAAPTQHSVTHEPRTIQAAATSAQVLATPVQAPDVPSLGLVSGAPSSTTSPGKGFVAAEDAASRRAEVLARIAMLKHLSCM